MTNEDLATRIQAGEDALTFQLWEQCKSFICKQAYRWAKAWKDRADFDVDDLIQAGYFALCDAVSSFQAERGSFITLLDMSLKTRFQEVARCQTMTQKLEPINGAVSLDAPAYTDPDNEVTTGDTIPANDTGFEDVEESLYQQQAATILHEAVDSIPKRQSDAINLYYFQWKTHQEIADCLNVSTSRAQQIVKQGLKDIRKSVYAPALTELFYSDQNFYQYSGFAYWKSSGMSSPERAAIIKERIETQYASANWGGKVSLLHRIGYSIETAQIVATLDSRTA